jgi:hypothetical protein
MRLAAEREGGAEDQNPADECRHDHAGRRVQIKEGLRAKRDQRLRSHFDEGKAAAGVEQLDLVRDVSHILS